MPRCDISLLVISFAVFCGQFASFFFEFSKKWAEYKMLNEVSGACPYYTIFALI